jgi:hypothetical protein
VQRDVAEAGDRKIAAENPRLTPLRLEKMARAVVAGGLFKAALKTE